MTNAPDFDELVGDVADDERARLERVHALLVQAGPPPELSPELAAGPDVMMTYRATRERPRKRRTMLLLAAAIAIAAVFFGGYAAGNRSGGDEAFNGGQVIKLRPTAASQVTAPESGNLERCLALALSGLRQRPSVAAETSRMDRSTCGRT